MVNIVNKEYVAEVQEYSKEKISHFELAIIESMFQRALKRLGIAWYELFDSELLEIELIKEYEAINLYSVTYKAWVNYMADQL